MRSVVFYSQMIKRLRAITTSVDLKTLRGLSRCSACGGVGLVHTRLRCHLCGGLGFARGSMK